MAQNAKGGGQAIKWRDKKIMSSKTIGKKIGLLEDWVRQSVEKIRSADGDARYEAEWIELDEFLGLTYEWLEIDRSLIHMVWAKVMETLGPDVSWVRADFMITLAHDTRIVTTAPDMRIFEADLSNPPVLAISDARRGENGFISQADGEAGFAIYKEALDLPEMFIAPNTSVYYESASNKFPAVATQLIKVTLNEYFHLQMR